IMGRWTEAKLEKIRSSRILTSQLLVETLLKMETKPALYIGASAIGYYGNRGDEKLTEQSPAGSGELADIVRVWEEIPQALEGSMRVVRMRFGVVLDKSGGALAKMLPAFKMGCGGILGSGKQMISWIAMEDLVRAVVFVMDNPIQGAVNCVAPNPVTNLEFTKTLGHQLHRPTILPMPETFIKLIFGSGAEIFLDSKNVMPQKLLSNNFVFSFPHLREALPVLC
ncbi:MAG: TIGR01777 family oxidoreductase, partial [Chlamydiae bacterium]|nr:TIGR01777 family oxidoreductase [Chlamydiota bacterium]